MAEIPNCPGMAPLLKMADGQGETAREGMNKKITNCVVKVECVVGLMLCISTEIVTVLPCSRLLLALKPSHYLHVPPSYRHFDRVQLMPVQPHYGIVLERRPTRIRHELHIRKVAKKFRLLLMA